MSVHAQATSRLIDGFGRTVDYVRLSVTDRCDFRCVYCMAEEMTFLPRPQILTLEELYLLGKNLTQLGVRKIRLTGGEPLIRKNIMWLVERLAVLPDLQELVLTTNGSQLEKYARPLVKAGVKRVNISLDSLQPERFRNLTRTGDVNKVIAGIDAACDAGFERVKLNCVVLKGRNDTEILPLVDFARARGIDLAFIEEMPLGNINEHSRKLSFMSSDEIEKIIATRYPLTTLPEKTAGPSRYFKMEDSPSRVGFISPHSHNFCGDCNRVRITAEGRLLLCLGNEHSMDLRAILRRPGVCDETIQNAFLESMALKPERHYFDLEGDPQIVRFMNMTGG